MQYYRILGDVEHSDGWFLKGPLIDSGSRLEADDLTSGRYVNADVPLHYSLRAPGKPLDLTFADFDVPIVKSDLAETFLRFSPMGVQLLPVNIEVNGTTINGYSVLNILECVSCLDEAHSRFVRWTESDGRADKIGQYRMITEIAIDSKRAAGHPVFRIAGWEVAVVIDQAIKEELQRLDISGVELKRLAVY